MTNENIIKKNARKIKRYNETKDKKKPKDGNKDKTIVKK
jgi:hypothetical protein